jgi:hypothetical protein
MDILIHPNSTVIKVLVGDVTLFFHNTQVVVEISDDTVIFFTFNLLAASCQDLISYWPSVYIRVNNS